MNTFEQWLELREEETLQTTGELGSGLTSMQHATDVQSKRAERVNWNKTKRVPYLANIISQLKYTSVNEIVRDVRNAAKTLNLPEEGLGNLATSPQTGTVVNPPAPGEEAALGTSTAGTI